MKHIAVEGNIGAGKTTLAEIICQKNNALFMAEEFEDNPFLARFYEDRKQYGLQVELSFLADRYKQMQKYFPEEDLFHDTIVSDYIIQKCSVFASHNLEDDEFNLFRRIYEIVESAAPKPDIIIHLHRPIPVLLNHIEKRGRNFEKPITPEYLKAIERSYKAHYDSIESPILIVDSDDKDFSSNPELLQPVWTFLNQKEMKRRSYLSL